MKVKELIAELQKVDPELEAVGYDSSFDPSELYSLNTVTVNPWGNNPGVVLLDGN